MEKSIKFEIRLFATAILFLIGYLGVLVINENQKSTEKIINSIEQRNALDSLYFEHLKECSMISKDEIEIDNNGYLYSKYKKEYNRNRETQTP